VSRKLQSDKIKKPVEIIILDSDSDTDVQIEVSGISNSMLVLYLIFFVYRNELIYKFSNFISIDVIAEKDSNEKTSVSAELDGVKSDHKFDNDQIEDNQDLSPATPSDLTVEANEGADKDKLNVEVIDLDSDSGADDVQMEALGISKLLLEQYHFYLMNFYVSFVFVFVFIRLLVSCFSNFYLYRYCCWE